MLYYNHLIGQRHELARNSMPSALAVFSPDHGEPRGTAFDRQVGDGSTTENWRCRCRPVQVR
jgi:hypothetical protein